MKVSTIARYQEVLKKKIGREHFHPIVNPEKYKYYGIQTC